jgi:hypothetical protein
MPDAPRRGRATASGLGVDRLLSRHPLVPIHTAAYDQEPKTPELSAADDFPSTAASSRQAHEWARVYEHLKLQTAQPNSLTTCTINGNMFSPSQLVLPSQIHTRQGHRRIRETKEHVCTVAQCDKQRMRRQLENVLGNLSFIQ